MTTNNTTNSEATNAPNQPPVAKLRIGSITGSVWQRTHAEGTFYSVSFERRYRDKDGQWHSSQSYNADDLLVLAKLADQAHSKILELRSGEAE